jgi:hypothetical protein
MPWPSKISRAFATETSVLENQYYGPYNKLLHTLFPVDTDFMVSPNYLPANVDGTSNFFISFKITLWQCTVLILQVKPPWHLDYCSSQKAADRQIHCHLVDLSGV